MRQQIFIYGAVFGALVIITGDHLFDGDFTKAAISALAAVASIFLMVTTTRPPRDSE